jgi:hypothetical protein
MSPSNQTGADRVRAILTSPHAKGREALAQRLAYQTSLTVEQAIGALAADAADRQAAVDAEWSAIVTKLNAEMGAKSARQAESAGPVAAAGDWNEIVNKLNAGAGATRP